MIVRKEAGIVPQDTTITKYDPVFLDALQPPFRLYGLTEPFRRVPVSVAEQTSEAVADLAAMCAGGRLRFSTDSDYIAIHAELESVPNPSFSTIATVSGFDIIRYTEDGPQFAGTVFPSQGEGKSYIEGRAMLGEGMKDLLISLPLFTKIRSLHVVLREGSVLESGSDYAHKVPLVFYGSSIVHGTCAGRPGSNYPAIVSRRLDRDFINLGFAGAAKAEPAILDYIGTLPMSTFIYDYDHNAPDAEYLEATHYEGYLRFRKAQPNTPVIMATKVDYHSNPALSERRRQIIFESYRKGIEAGDRHLYLVDGSRIYDPEYRTESTADGCHPNDAGYLAMAKTFKAVIERALAEAENSEGADSHA